VTQAIVGGIANGAIFGLVALGIVLVYKGTKVLNFAQGELGTIALFVTWWFVEEQGLPYGLGALAGIAASVVIALAFERTVVRRMVEAERLSIAVATVGLFFLLISVEVLVFSESLLLLPPPIAGLGPRVLGFFLNPSYMVAFAAMALIGGGLALFLRRTDFGLGVLAASQDPVAVRLVGIRYSRVSMFTWGMAGFLGAVAALLIQPLIGAFEPGFMTAFFVRGLAAALIGGLTNLTGAFLGGIVIGVLDAVVGQLTLGSTFPGIQSVVVFMVIIAVLLAFPNGVAAGLRRRA
jgi:branched-chain amino acid transport system permease protein